MELKALWYWREHPYEALIKASNEELLQFGPYTVMMFDLEELRNEVTYVSKPLLKYLLDMAKLIRVGEDPDISYKDAMTIVEEIFRNASSYNNRDYQDYYMLYAQYTAEACKEMMSAILTAKRGTKSLESAMLNYAPIVPYGKRIRKFSVPAKESDDGYIKKESGIYSVQLWSPIVTSGFTVDETLLRLVKYPFDILKHAAEYTIDPLGYSTTTNSGKKEQIISDDLWKLIREDYVANGTMTPSSFSRFYFICAYFTYLISIWGEGCRNMIKDTVTNLCRAVDRVDKKESISISQAAESFGQIGLPENELDKPSEVKEDADDKFGKLCAIHAHEDEEINKFPLNLLTSYIYTARRFKIDPSINQLFMQQYGGSVSDPSYLENDIMITKYKPKDGGVDEERIITPAVDLADTGGFSYVLLSMNREGKVNVLSQDDVFGVG